MADDPRFPDISLGLISWKGRASLRNALATYREAGLFDLFGEVLVFFQEFDDDDKAIVEEFGLPYEASPENKGILGGFDYLANRLTGDLLLLLENDGPLLESRERVIEEVERGRQALLDGTVDVYRLRHRKEPGQKMASIKKYKMMYPAADAPFPEKLTAYARRCLQPHLANRRIGAAAYVEAEPDKRFPGAIRKDPRGFFVVPAGKISWTNQSILVKRDFYRDKIVGYAKANPEPAHRLINGHPDVEKELNRTYWFWSKWKVGVGDGLFTHIRIDRPKST